MRTATAAFALSLAVHGGAAWVLSGLFQKSAHPCRVDEPLTLEVSEVEFSAADIKAVCDDIPPATGDLPPGPVDAPVPSVPADEVLPVSDASEFPTSPIEAAIPPPDRMPEPQKDTEAPVSERAGIDAPAKLLEPVILVYPALSRMKGEEGKVVVQFTVDEEGRAGDVSVAVSSGYARLDAAAVKAVARARFSPAVKNSRPCLSRAAIPLFFKLRKSEE